MKLCVSMLMVATVALSSTTDTQAQRELFDRGTQLYLDTDYAGAIQAYEEILRSGYEAGEVYYNIANSHFKLGDLGRSILNYERALLRMPGDEDTIANLTLARSLAVDDIEPLPRFWFFRFVDWWVHAIPASLLLVVVTLCYVVATVATAVRILSRQALARALGLRVAIACAAVAVVLGVNLSIVRLGLGQPMEGVILVDEVTVQSAPTADAALQIFAIHEGTKVRVDQLTGGWAEIVLSDGKVGWVKSDVLEVV